MQVSKQKVNQTLEKQIMKMWYQLLVDIKNLGEAEKVFAGLFSQTELITFAKRLAVGYWLSKNRSYENIKQNLKVSSATIASVQQGLKGEGWKAAMTKVSADEWATVWEGKIRKLLGRSS